MRQSRKQTAWKKSRTFGDVKGGRRWHKLKDNIVKRKHSAIKTIRIRQVTYLYGRESVQRLLFPYNNR